MTNSPTVDLNALVKRLPGCDGFNLPPPTQLAIHNSIKLVKALALESYPPYNINYSTNGGIGISVKAGHRKVYVECLNDDRIELLYSNGVNEPVIASNCGIGLNQDAIITKIKHYLNSQFTS